MTVTAPFMVNVTIIVMVTISVMDQVTDVTGHSNRLHLGVLLGSSVQRGSRSGSRLQSQAQEYGSD